ncbi:hypothetical protein QSJ18_09270 [Gordonia sp. ABSL1-1]|uniref:hypothetical protein n=1 Tax=Gordonia sp. ABSL1-1 TaxID=3053923 RepID=UPI00257382A2|nr:hypothetical protein [Gordonia sp. ABSL1-1]MDL9936928.1 hypothetical protein [Gordonia sp. ABSL1-1]
MRLLAGNRPALVIAAALSILLSAGCATGSEVTARRLVPADLLLRPEQLPRGFVPLPAPVTVADLVEQNRPALAAAAAQPFVPDGCRPTADAELNDQLSTDNSAVLAARRARTLLVELVTEVRRDLVADLRASTSGCARTETTIVRGNLRGTKVVTEFTTLAEPAVEGGLRPDERMLLLRSEVTSTLPDGGIRKQISLAGYAVLDRAETGPVTVQLTVAGETTPASATAGAPAAPLADAEFVGLFGSAVAAVTSPGR